MGIPQIIVLVIYMIALGMSLADDGKVKMKKESRDQTQSDHGFLNIISYSH